MMVTFKTIVCKIKMLRNGFPFFLFKLMLMVKSMCHDGTLLLTFQIIMHVCILKYASVNVIILYGCYSAKMSVLEERI